AVGIARRAVAADGGAVEPRIVMGEVALARGNAGEALLDYEQAVLLDPHSQAAVDGLVRVYGAGHVSRGMLRHMESIGGHEPLAAVDAQQRNDNSAAIRQYETALRGGEKSGVAANNLAWLYAAEGTKLDRALSLAQQALAVAPFDPRVLDTVGYVRLQRHEYSE